MGPVAEECLARIARGERLESAAEMTPEYHASLVHLMTMQADSELAGGYGYVPWIMKAPTVEEKHVVAQIVKDELRHALVMYSLLADLGVDVGEHVKAHDDVFTMRIKLPANYKIPPHHHPSVERLTILSGQFNAALGDTFDPSKAKELKAGSYMRIPPKTHHFGFTKEETVIQLTTIGPWDLVYVNPADDPRK